MSKFRNERGAITFYAMSLLGITMLLFFLMINMIKIYVTEQQATTSAEQAALAATDTVIDTVYEAVTENGYITNLEERKEDLEEFLATAEDLSPSIIAKIEAEIAAIDDVLGFKNDVESKKDELIAEGVYKNQAGMEAVDIVLTEKLEKAQEPHDHSIYTGFRLRVQSALSSSTTSIADQARQFVNKNAGEISETTIKLFNSQNRIEVKTAAKYEESSFNGFFTNGSENIEQKAVGPSLDFIDEIHWSTMTFH